MLGTSHMFRTSLIVTSWWTTGGLSLIWFQLCSIPPPLCCLQCKNVYMHNPACQNCFLCSKVFHLTCVRMWGVASCLPKLEECQLPLFSHSLVPRPHPAHVRRRDLVSQVQIRSGQWNRRTTFIGLIQTWELVISQAQDFWSCNTRFLLLVWTGWGLGTRLVQSVEHRNDGYKGRE